MEQAIADFYTTLATSMAGLFIITGAFVIFQYQNISVQTTQTYDLLRKYLDKAHKSNFLTELIAGDQNIFKDYQHHQNKFDKSFELWLEKDIMPRFNPMIILYYRKYEQKLRKNEDCGELFAICDYYLAIKAQEDRKRVFGNEFKGLVFLNGCVFIASISMILFKVCFSFSFLALLTLGFLFLTVYVVCKNIDCIFKGLTGIKYDQINNWSNAIVDFQDKYPQKKVDEIINEVKAIREKI